MISITKISLVWCHFQANENISGDGALPTAHAHPLYLLYIFYKLFFTECIWYYSLQQA